MEIELKRIKYDKYDELLGLLDSKNFFTPLNPITKLIEEYSESIYVNNEIVKVDINVNDYQDIIDKCEKKRDSSFLIAQKLYKDFDLSKTKLPKYIMYEKEFWTYLNLTIFKLIIKNKYVDMNEKKDALDAKLERLYFNTGGYSKIDRTGLRYLWVLADITYYNSSFELTDIALDFIDPFKALQECVLGKNKIILQAFALAIKKLDYDIRIRGKEFKKIIPKHIRNYACCHFLDAYFDVEELSGVLASEIKASLELI